VEESFRTLREFLAGKEREEGTYFAYSATLRIWGEISDMDEISTTLGLVPTRSPRKGEKRGGDSHVYRQDMWPYSPTVEESEPLHNHIDALWLRLKPHKRYLLGPKKSLNVDVFVGYRSNCDTAGIEVPHTSLEIFTELEIPFGVSIIVT
jgi:hypothetical protein